VETVFRALADPTRRALLDALFTRDGQTLVALTAGHDMTRIAVAKHLRLLEEAGLVVSRRQGREKLHYLNPVPLHEIQERWIDKFERPRLRTLAAVKRRSEEPAMIDQTGEKPAYVYVTYIESTPERVWEALTDAEVTAQYWGHRNESDWKAGSEWRHVRTDGSGESDVIGTVVESDPPRRLVTTWSDPRGDGDAGPSRAAFDIQPYGGIVRLTVTHTDIANERDLRDLSNGWPAVLSNLKSLLELGQPMSLPPWKAPVG
jgi:uncharacterized protein YndB with AHSA1/START domain/DNA-binding transcriptional ArsR family regulator